MTALLTCSIYHVGPFCCPKIEISNKKRGYNKVAETESVNADYTVCFIVHVYVSV